jgi:redox-sensitive bicupin YhaK (pirin superfamily)
MLVARRQFLLGTGAVLLGCNAQVAPAVVSVTRRRVERTLLGMPTTDGAGVSLKRVIGQPALRNLDPFIMLDRFHSDEPNAYIRGFPNHPHRGFETVTVMLEGQMRHRDSRGNQGLITGGGSQWMTAGRGIVHSEMPEQQRGLMSGYQLWVNLPAREKGCPQFYQDLVPSALAESPLAGSGHVRVIAGHINGLAGPVRERPTDPTLATLVLEDEQPFEIDTPSSYTSFLFVGSGEIEVGPDGAESVIGAGNIAILGAGDRVRLRARSRSDVLLAVGRPLHEPIVQRGPFVMNTEAEIQQAWADYRAGVLDKT